MRLVLVVTVLLGFALAVGCGNPSRKPAFEFTPIPYTMVPGSGGTPIAVADYEGGTIIADEIGALVERDQLDAFLHRISELGFNPLSVSESDPANVNLGVPLGSAPDAVGEVQRIDGVVAANVNSTRRG